MTQGAGVGHPERDDSEQPRDDRGKRVCFLYLLICHRSERSEVKRSRESMFYGLPRRRCRLAMTGEGGLE
ncbi:MAG: hypothetical protein NC218_08775 [Acetobacter sp.]|nr:hypothetical protein [Acetobacter sp.]